MWTHQDVWDQLISGMYASTNEMLSPLSVCTCWGHEGMHCWLSIICTAFTSPLTPYVFGSYAAPSALCALLAAVAASCRSLAAHRRSGLKLAFAAV